MFQIHPCCHKWEDCLIFWWLNNLVFECVCVCVCVCNCFLYIYSQINGHLGCFHVLTIVNYPDSHTGVQMSFQVSVFVSFWYILRSGIVRLCGSSVFNFLRNLPIIFYSAWTSLQSHHQCTKVPFSLHPHQHLSLLVILMMTILKGMTQYIIALWICISLIISDVEHSFTKLLVFHVSALEKNVFWDLLPIFKSNYLFFYYWVVWVPHIFWILTPKSDIGWKYFSSHSVACFFTSLFASCFWEHFSLV